MPVNRAGELLGRRVLAAVGVVFACALAAPSFAVAETFTVNSTADEVDASPGNEFCETAAGKCTLRAAIEEANSTTEAFDAIGFEEGVFEGDGASVIELSSALPAITTPLSLSGRECETEASVPGPCVEVDGLANAPVLDVEGVAEVEVEMLALTSGEAGIAAEEAPRLRVRGSWLGVGLDGAAAGNGTGLLLGPGSDGSRIGGEGPEAGNLVANSTGTGLDILGSSNVLVLGNEFGVAPGGAVAAPNEADVEIASLSGFEANGNAIGGRLSAMAAATAACDGACNLLAGSSGHAVNLGGDEASAEPAVATTIAGNYVGLDASGSAVLSDPAIGILVGEAPQTVVGGPKTTDANRIAGGTMAIFVGQGTPDFVARGNLIGTETGAPSSAPDIGIAVDSEGLSSPAVEAIVADNRIGMEGDAPAILQRGYGATISGNFIRGAGIGIETRGSNEGHGNRIEGNRIEGASANGIRIENDANEIFGNEVVDAAKAGIQIWGEPPFGVFDNVVGGDTSPEENLIVGSGGAAIEISNLEATQTEVGRNRGSGNAGLFVDLIGPDTESEPNGPNSGILPPSITTASAAGVAGEGEPGALIRVFRKQTPLPGEIESFIGQTRADAEGNWALSFAAPLPPGTNLAATQMNEGGGTSELALAATAAENDGGGASPPPGAMPPPGGKKRPPILRAPQTRIVRQPQGLSRQRTVRFAFASKTRNARFQCSLDGQRFRVCKSPKRYGPLPPGMHVFKVRAIDQLGNVDPTPATRRFRVLG